MDAVFSDGYQGLLFDAGGEANLNGIPLIASAGASRSPGDFL
jgi:hypothetical protein